MSKTSKMSQMQSSSAVFFHHTVFHAIHFMVNKMVRTCKAWLCTWYAKEHQMRVQVLPKHKLLVKQMSSWHLDKSPYCCNWKGKCGIYNELQRYTYWLSCCSAPVYAEEVGLALP